MSVYKREWKDKQGKTRFCWYFHKTINGMRYRERIPTARNKTQAETRERAILAQIHAGTYGKQEDSISDFIDQVYLPWARANKRHPVNDEMHCKTIRQFFEGKTFEQVSPLLIEKFKRERLATPVVRIKKVKGVEVKTEWQRAPATVNRELEVLSKIFTMAVDNGITASNPCRKVKKFRQDNQRNRYLTTDEEEKLMAALNGRRAHLRPIVVIALNTGMRRGEILGLTWSNVDLVRGLIYVTNTKSGVNRIIPINKTVKAELEALEREGERVFNIDWIKRSFMSALREAKIKNFRFHDLRHTAATRLADAGADAFTIAAILGHSTIQMSARYTHATDERKRRALEAISMERVQSGHNLVTMKKERSA